jgi:hypothetical protein
MTILQGRDVTQWLRRKTTWQRKQAAARLTGARYYGDGGTIHGTTYLNIETDSKGDIVSVWFRCQALPYEIITVDDQRADEMCSMYKIMIEPVSENHVYKPEYGMRLTGIEVQQ